MNADNLQKYLVNQNQSNYPLTNPMTCPSSWKKDLYTTIWTHLFTISIGAPNAQRIPR